jgi:VWFA-related protein
MRSSFLAPVALLIGTGFAQVPDVVIRSSVREVLLDVVVRDAHGHLVTNLKPGEVTVYEDGVRQDVRSFRLVAGSEVRVEDQKQAAETQAVGTSLAASNTTRPGVNPLRTVNLVCIILSDLNQETRATAFNAARRFVDQELRPNTFIGVFSLDRRGLRLVFPFSNNRERLLKAVELAAINQLPPINTGVAAMLNGLGFSPPGGITAGDSGSVGDPLGTWGDMGFSVNGGLDEIHALLTLIRQLSPVPFHKTVLFFSTGFTKPPDQLEYWDLLINSASKGGVTFYAMDVYGLGVCQGDTNPDCVAHSALATSSAMLNYIASLSRGQATAASAPAKQVMEMARQDDYLKFTVSSSNRQEALRELAERTGGFLIANTNNTDKLLAHVMEEVDTHYEIAYPPTAVREDGHFRKIEVKLARPGLHVETRSGYFAVPDTGEHPVTPAEMAGLRALDTQPRPHAFEFLSRAYRFREAGGTAQYAIAFEMPISNLTATPGVSGKTHLLHGSLLALVKNAQGQIVDRVSKDVPSEVSDDRLAAVQVELMTYQHAVNLAPGHYTVEAAVVDHEGNRASTSVVQIDNREQRGVGLSDLALVRRLENLGRPPDAADPFEFPGNEFEFTGKRVLPFVTTDLFAGAIPSVYFMVYPEPGNPAKPELRVRLLKNGRLAATRKLALPPPDESGGIPMWIEETKQPGSYELRVTVVEGRSSTERSLAYTIAGK